MIKSKLACASIAPIALTAVAALAQTYEGGSVPNGGQVEGTVTLQGNAPAQPAIQVDKNMDYCGTSIPEDEYVVNGKHQIENVVVTIDDIDHGKPVDKNAVIKWDNLKCMFQPHVAVAVAGQTLAIDNSDPILHNTHLHLMPTNRTLFNAPLPFQGIEIKKTRPLAEPGIIRATCDAHHWMLGWIYVGANPYITKTDSAGHFKLDDIPPGSYTLTFWHEKFGTQTQKVTVAAAGRATVNASFSP